MEIKNLTPHAINLLIDGEYVEYPSSGKAPRVSEHQIALEGNYPFEAVRIEYQEVQDLPEPEDGVVLIVSKMVCDARPSRRDLWYPAKLVRDEAGRIVGCDALARLEP